MSFISIKDNFFSEEKYNKIVEHMLTADYGAPSDGACFMKCLDQEEFPVSIINERIKKVFNLDFKEVSRPTCYTMVGASDMPRPHDDLEWGCTSQCLIYMKGEELINNGTGFYTKKEDKNILSTHVGFKQNRAILFISTIIHSPLQWAGESSFRYSICNFLR